MSDGPTLQDVLDLFYKNEINVTIQSFFDSGWEWAIGDRFNGYSARGSAESLPKLVEDLHGALIVELAEVD